MRVSYEKPIGFHKWLNKQHITEIAYKLGVCEQTVRYWLMYNRVPKDVLKHKLVKIAKGSLAYEDFFM
jgi:hypothetical protein